MILISSCLVTILAPTELIPARFQPSFHAIRGAIEMPHLNAILNRQTSNPIKRLNWSLLAKPLDICRICEIHRNNLAVLRIQ